MQEGVVQVTVTGRVPVLLVIVGALRAREESLLEDTGVSGLVEGGNAELLVRVFLDDPESVFVGVERRHQDEGDIDAVGGVEVLDLSHSQVEEGHVVLDFECTLRSGHTHGSSETTVDLEDGELVEVLLLDRSREVGIGHDLVISGGVNPIPVTRMEAVSVGSSSGSATLKNLQLGLLGTFGKIASEEVEE